MKNRNLILIIIIIGILFPMIKQRVHAASPLLYIDPITINKEIGDNFSLSVVLDPKGQRVCVAEGSLNMGGLLCDNMNLGSNISYLVKPVCDNSRFILGIQGCTSSKKTLFTVDLEMSSVNDVMTSLTGVDIIGVGESISSGSIGNTIISKITGAIKDVIEQLKNAIPGSQIAKTLKEKLQELLEPVNDVKEVINWLKDANLGNEAKKIFQNKLSELLSPVNDVKEVIGYLKDTNLGDEAKNILQNKLGQLLEPVNDVKEVINWLKDTNLGDEVKGLLKNKLNELLEPIEDAGEITKLLKGVNPGSDLEQILKGKLQNILQPITDIADDVQDTIDTVGDTIDDVGNAIEDGKTIVENVVDFFSGIVDFFKALGK